MEDRFKELVNKLACELKLRTFDFMHKNLQEEEEIGDILNLVLSSHVSSLFSLLYDVSNKSPRTHESVIQFTDEMRKFIHNNEMISSLNEFSMEH